MRNLCAAVWALLLPLAAQRIITTVAGTDVLFPSGPQSARQAPLGEVFGISAAPDGSLYFCDRQNHVVVRMTLDGMLQVVAGNGLRGLSGDGGPATSASLAEPDSAVVDASGNLYIADQGNLRIRVVNAQGVISTLPGVSVSPLIGITMLGVDSAGHLLVASSRTGDIRVVDAPGQVRTLAKGLSFPAQIAADGVNIYSPN